MLLTVKGGGRASKGLAVVHLHYGSAKPPFPTLGEPRKIAQVPLELVILK